MFSRLLTALFGNKHQREIKKIWPKVEEIDRLAEGLKDLSDADLRQKTEDFKQAVARGREEGRAEAEILDEILPEAYAVVKEACRRHLGKSWKVVGIEKEWDMVPFDVQLLGAIVLHQGKIAEMATGEGKTLVAIFPLYLNALAGRGVHLVTVNDYLARRDSQCL